jgi:transposase-like protein
MNKKKIQDQQGYSLLELFKDYGTEEQCTNALFNWKWPQGFNCPECGATSYCTLNSRKVYQCNNCHHQTSLTSGTIFSSTKLPLTHWFLAMNLIIQAKKGISAVSLGQELGVCYNTAWAMKHKIMQVMKTEANSYLVRMRL